MSDRDLKINPHTPRGQNCIWYEHPSGMSIRCEVVAIDGGKHVAWCRIKWTTIRRALQRKDKPDKALPLDTQPPKPSKESLSRAQDALAMIGEAAQDEPCSECGGSGELHAARMFGGSTVPCPKCKPGKRE